MKLGGRRHSGVGSAYGLQLTQHVASLEAPPPNIGTDRISSKTTGIHPLTIQTVNPPGGRRASSLTDERPRRRHQPTAREDTIGQYTPRLGSRTIKNQPPSAIICLRST